MSSLISPTWEKSPAHLELLSKFLKSESPERFTHGNWNSIWKGVLKETPAKAIKRFIDEGYLAQPGLDSLLDYKFRVSDLKGFCKTRNLPVSGNKPDLIDRLIKADEHGMKKEVSKLKVYSCSEKGKALVLPYLEIKRQEKISTEEIILADLKKRDFKHAARTMISYEANQVFQRGLGINWKRETEKPYVDVLSGLFKDTPTILRGIDPEKLDYLKVVAGFDYLWGSPKPELLKGMDNVSEKFDNTMCVSMLWAYAKMKLELEEYRELARELREYYKVVIYTCNDEHVCEECKKLAEKKYPLSEDIPELPNPKCSHGCRCYYSLDVGFN